MEALNPGLPVGQADGWMTGGLPGSPAGNPPSQEPLRLLEIERELAGPGAQEALARHDAVLAGLGRRIDDALAAGVPPEEYPKIESLREANILARKLLRLAARDGETNKP